MKTRHYYEHGGISGAAIAAIILGVFTTAFAGVALWSFLSYHQQKTDVDGKIALAVAEAKKDQADEDEKKFAEREKEPRREFVGPDDFGRVTFMYPKTWSSYVAKNGTSGGNYEAYLNPGVVPSVAASQPFALRVVISDQEFDKVLAKYDGQIKKGDLKASGASANGQSGQRLDGNFTKDIRGAAVFYKIRDKTLAIYTDIDSSDIKSEFEAIIKTVKFNT